LIVALLLNFAFKVRLKFSLPQTRLCCCRTVAI
jgi:hypothetical protein